MYDIWNEKASSALQQGANDAFQSLKHWRSMAASVAKNVNARKDVYTWDGKYIATIVPLN